MAAIYTTGDWQVYAGSASPTTACAISAGWTSIGTMESIDLDSRNHTDALVLGFPVTAAGWTIMDEKGRPEVVYTALGKRAFYWKLFFHIVQRYRYIWWRGDVYEATVIAEHEIELRHVYRDRL